MTDRAYAFRNGWRWIGWYIRRGLPVAAMRQAWLAYIVGDDGEACQVCGRSYALWRASNELYGEVTGRWPKPWNDGSGRAESASGLFCHDCFTDMADKQGITLQWVPRNYHAAALEARDPAPSSMTGGVQSEEGRQR